MPQSGFVPQWQRALIVLSSTTVLAIIVLVLFLARSIAIPIALAIFFTFVLSPMIVRLQHRGMPRGASVGIVVGVAMMLLVGVGAVIAQQVVKLSEEITQPEHAETFKRKITEGKNALNQTGSNNLGSLIDDVSRIVSPNQSGRGDPVLVAMQSDSMTGLGRVESYLTPTAEIAAQAAFTFILTIFMMLRREDLRNRMIRLTGHGKVSTTTKALDDASQRISRYLLAQLIVNATFGAVIAVALLLIGVKLVLLWGVIAMLMRYVPYLGTWIALIPPMLFSFALSDGWSQPLAVLGIFVVLDAICANAVEPLVYGRSMGISEVAQLVAAAFWALLWGPIGLILSGPLTVCLLVLGKHVSRFEYFDILLGDEPVLAPGVMFYQRLAARDQDEASELAHRQLKDSNVASVCDALIIPALCVAKRDYNDGDYPAEEFLGIVRRAREVGEELIADSVTEPSPVNRRVRILLCPARDESDQVAIALLAATLDPGRWEAEVVATDILASDLLSRIESFRPAVLIIGSLPPGELSHTRYLVARVRAKYPELKQTVGRWGRGLFENEESSPIERTGADWMDSTLAETTKRLSDWYEVLATGDEKENGRFPNERSIGTTSALVNDRMQQATASRPVDGVQSLVGEAT